MTLSTVACARSGDDGASGSDAITSACVDGANPGPADLDAAIGRWIGSVKTDLGGAEGLRRIDAIVGNAKLIGLGEPDHGFHEFAQLRNDVFEMLVGSRDVRALTLETGIIEAHLVDQYVTDVTGARGIALSDVLANGFTHDMGEWQETQDLVEWVRKHNVEAAAAGKPLIRWGGKDLTVRGDTLTVPLKDLSAFFARVGGSSRLDRLSALATKASAVTDLVEQTLQQKANIPHIDPDFLDAVCSLSYDQLTDDEQVEVGTVLSGLLADMDQNRADYVAKTSADDFDWARQLVVVAQQIHEDLDFRAQRNLVYGPTNSAGFTLTFLQKVYAAIGTDIPPMRHGQIVARDYTPEELAAFEAGRSIREVHLAANVQSLVDRYGKTFDFAAASHLYKVKLLEDSGFAAAEGNFLADHFKSDYVVIAGTASDFDDGPGDIAQTRQKEKARPGSLESRLEKAGTQSPYVFDLRKTKAETCDRPEWVTSWLGSPQLTWIGPVKRQVVPSQGYDAVYWVPKATRGHRLAAAAAQP
jgi:erythromycin esterase-like protein